MPVAKVIDDKIYLFSPFQFKDRCKSIPGAWWDEERRAWKYPATAGVANRIVASFRGDLQVSPDFHTLVQNGKDAGQAKRAEDLPPIPVTNTEPWLHQLRAYHFSSKLPASGLFLDMGTGKSKVVVDRVANAGYRRTLIICPHSVVGVWPKQFREHCGKSIHVAAMQSKHSVKRKTEEARQAVALAEAMKQQVVIVINYESVYRDPFGDYVLSELQPDLVVLDESHRIKSPGGVTSLFCSRLGKVSKNRMCLTGTPMPHSPLDIYAQYRFLDPGIFGTSFNRFKNRYAIMGGFHNKQVFGFQNEEELNRLMYSIAYRVTKTEVLDLPPVTHNPRTCSISSKARGLYSELENEFIAELSEGTVTVSNALTKLLRLQQVTSGFVKDDEGQLHNVDTEKQKLLADILEDIPQSEPVVVFCRFHHDIDAVKAIAAKTKRRYGELSGRQNDLTEDSTLPPDVDLMAVQIQSGGVGIDLTRSCHSVYYSIGFSLGEYEQSLARMDRPGQTRSVRYYHLIAENTVDEAVYAALKKRKKVVEFILSGFTE